MQDFEVGDKVWVLCEVLDLYESLVCTYIDVEHHGEGFRAKRSDCRPVEPSASSNDFVALAMQMACEQFSVSGDTFNGANFSNTFRQLAGVTCNLDGHVVATILSGRSDVEVLKGGSHYRFLSYEQKTDATCEQAESTPVPSRPVEPSGIKESLMTEPDAPKSLDSSIKLEYYDKALDVDQVRELCEKGKDSEQQPTPKPSKTQPPSGYRMLGPAKNDPRQTSDLYWSLSAKNWIPIKFKQVEYANRDDWVACRKIEVTSSPPKRHRDPTLSDLTNGPIVCEYRDSDEEQWRSGLLVYILNGCFPFLCVSQEQKLSGHWGQCQIEVTG
jgi:hypothetical protein